MSSGCIDCGGLPLAFEARRCVTCQRERRHAQARARYAENRAKERLRMRERRQREPEAMSAIYAKWRAGNLEKERRRHRDLYRADPEKARARVKAWTEAHPGCHALRYRNNPESRKAAQFKRRAGGTASAQDLKALRATESFCAYCLQPGASTVDHVWPLSRSGANDLENLVMACTSCNASKRDRTPLEFIYNWRNRGRISSRG